MRHHIDDFLRNRFRQHEEEVDASQAWEGFMESLDKELPVKKDTGIGVGFAILSLLAVLFGSINYWLTYEATAPIVENKAIITNGWISDLPNQQKIKAKRIHLKTKTNKNQESNKLKNTTINKQETIKRIDSGNVVVRKKHSKIGLMDINQNKETIIPIEPKQAYLENSEKNTSFEEEDLSIIPLIKEELNESSKTGQKKLFFITGLNTSKGFNNMGGKRKMDYSFHLGIGASYTLSRKIDINMELSYIQRGNNNINSNNLEEVEYFLYARKIYNKINTNSLSYIHIPVSLAFQISGNHKLSIGPYIDILAGSNKNVEEVVSTPFTTQINSKDQRSSIQDGIKPYNYGFSLGYTYQLNNQFKIGLRVNHGLLDITENDFFQQKHRDFLTDYQLNLIYTLK